MLGAAHPHMKDVTDVLAQTDRIRLVGLWDQDTERGERWAEQTAVPLATDQEELIARPDVDCFFILSETCFHEELAVAVANSGRHLFVEKPLATTTAAAQRVANAVQRGGGLFHTGYFLRDVPAHVMLRELVAAGALGQPIRARAHFAHPAALHGWAPDDAWIADPAKAGVGGFGDLGLHLIDLVTWITNRPVRRVTAWVGSRGGRDHLDQHGEGLLELEGGVVASIASGWTESPGRMSVEVSGTGGGLLAMDGQLSAWGQASIPQGLVSQAPDARTAVVRFLDAVCVGERNRLVPVETAAWHVSLLEQLYEAARTGLWLDVS